MRTRATAFIFVVACAIGACGDDGPSKDEKQIRATLTEALTTKDPSVCTRLATQRFIEQSTAERGKAAIRSCREDASENSAQSISFGRVAVSGPRASADLRPTADRLPFKTLRVGLRKPAGRWKIDRIKSGTLDRAAFFRFFRMQMTSPPDALSGRHADCVLRRFKSIENVTIVRALLEVDLRLFAIPSAICGVTEGVAGRGVPKGVVVCAQRRLRRELTSGGIGRRLAADPARAEALFASSRSTRTVRRIFASCARG